MSPFQEQLICGKVSAAPPTKKLTGNPAPTVMNMTPLAEPGIWRTSTSKPTTGQGKPHVAASSDRDQRRDNSR